MKWDGVTEKIDDWALDNVPVFLYRIPILVKQFFRSIKYFTQKVFRKHHTSDMEIWNLHTHLAKIILPKLYAFKKAKRVSYPASFSEYYENEWKSQEEYEEAIKNGSMSGGGPEKWNEILDEMIFGFEYVLYEDEDDFYTRWDIENPHAKKEENIKTSYWYRDGEGGLILTGKLSDSEMGEKGYTLEKETMMYYNIELHTKHAERAQKGLELFGKHFFNLWD